MPEYSTNCLSSVLFQSDKNFNDLGFHANSVGHIPYKFSSSVDNTFTFLGAIMAFLQAEGPSSKRLYPRYVFANFLVAPS